MKLKLMGVVCLVAIICFAAPGWSQDSTQPAETQPAAEKPAEAKPAAEQPVETQPAPESAVTIEEAAVCEDVVDRAPVGASDVFAKETAKVYCFCRVVGAEEGSQITHNWYHNGTLKASVKLNVRSSNFRTWSSKNLVSTWTGEWMVEILSQDGKPLESIIFSVQ